MKALSLTQPWATGVDRRIKLVETRSWRTPYRGELVIHAAKGFPAWAKQFAAEERALLGINRIAELPLGLLLCVVNLLGCRRTEDVADQLSDKEQEWGDYSPGRFAWFFEYVRPLNHIECRGGLGLWTVPHETMSQAEVGSG